MDTKTKSKAYAEQTLLRNAEKSVMQPILYRGRFFEVETDNGTYCIDQQLIGKSTPDSKELQPYVEGKIDSFRVVDGYGAYLSMPGYLDRTELTVFTNRQTAIEYLNDLYN